VVEDGLCVFPNCKTWITNEGGVQLSKAKCTKCSSGFGLLNDNCSKCDNYFDNTWESCADCTFNQKGVPLNCIACMDDKVLLDDEDA